MKPVATAILSALFIHSAFAGAIFSESFTSAKSAEAWQKWSPRSEISPSFAFDQGVGHQQSGSLKLQARHESDFGAWRTTVEHINPGQNYLFSAWYRAENIPLERRSVIARIVWLDKNGDNARPPEYGIDIAQEGEWKRVEIRSAAPSNATKLDVQLSLAFANDAKLWWDDVSLVTSTPDEGRVIKATTVFHRPRSTASAAESVEQFCQLAAQAANEKPDIICLPEGITVVGTGKTYDQVSEAIPGPTTERLGKLATQLHSYVVAGIYEKLDKIIYNTAVLIGRDGKLVGKYRKTHLPREEWEAGITPGKEYPVFDTDFGKVGLMICWDVQFPEPCRAMGAKGADLVLLPIWGGNEILAKARAIENHLFLVSSSYDMKTFIVDPVGTVLAQATKEQPVVTAELHLDRIIYEPWLGNMKNRTWKELRPDIPVFSAR